MKEAADGGGLTSSAQDEERHGDMKSCARAERTCPSGMTCILERLKRKPPHDLRPDQGCVSRCESARRDLGYAKQAEANRNDADAFAESLRPIVAPFIHLSSRRIRQGVE
jgi:hypothetical protein